MGDMIRQIRERFPFDMSEEEMCGDSCSYGCPRNLLEYMHAEISDWEQRMQQGEIPNFGDIQKFSKSGRMIYRVLEKNQLIKKED